VHSSNDLKLCGCITRMRKAVPPPPMWDFVRMVKAGRCQLMTVKPGGVAMSDPGFKKSKEMAVSKQASK